MSLPNAAIDSAGRVLPVHLVSEASLAATLATLPPAMANYAAAMRFQAKSGRILALPEASGGLGAVLFGIGGDEGLAENPFLIGKLATDLPAGRYQLEGRLDKPGLCYLGFLNGLYRFDRFRTTPREAVELVLPEGGEAEAARIAAAAMANGRDLINRPANDLTTAALAEAALALAGRFGAKSRAIVGDDLLSEGFPMVHAVGRASAVAPRLVEFSWGDPGHPRLTLVGKGVVFDTGGLNLKPDSSMLLMRKDMGGAAAALTAAEIIMAERTRVSLHVVVPIVENAVSGPAFRPGDIFRTRKGISVEIGNTDAEGRLILADALAFADERKPDLMLDFATLTGAARVALGPDLPPFFTDEESLAAEIAETGRELHDPVWRLPLWKPYLSMLDSKFADMNNVSSGGFAGAITAALFLRQFVSQARAYAHFDIYAWNPSAKPGRPEGGEPQAARLAARLAQKLAARP